MGDSKENPLLGIVNHKVVHGSAYRAARKHPQILVYEEDSLGNRLASHGFGVDTSNGDGLAISVARRREDISDRWYSPFSWLPGLKTHITNTETFIPQSIETLDILLIGEPRRLHYDVEYNGKKSEQDTFVFALSPWESHWNQERDDNVMAFHLKALAESSSGVLFFNGNTFVSWLPNQSDLIPSYVKRLERTFSDLETRDPKASGFLETLAKEIHADKSPYDKYPLGMGTVMRSIEYGVSVSALKEESGESVTLEDVKNAKVCAVTFNYTNTKMNLGRHPIVKPLSENNASTFIDSEIRRNIENPLVIVLEPVGAYRRSLPHATTFYCQR